MKNFSQIITEPNVRQDADTNEVIGVLLAASCLAFTCAPIIGALGNGISSFFSSLFGDKKDDKDKDDKDKGNKGKDTSTPNKDNKKDGDTASKDDTGKSEQDPKDRKSFNYLLMLSKKANEKEKDENAKKKNDALLKLITASAFDKDGNEVPIDKIAENMKDSMSPEQFEAFKKDMTEAYEKNKNNQEFKDALAKAKANIKPEEYDKMLEEAKATAKSTLEQIEKERKEIEEHEKKLKEMEEEINGGDEKDKEIRELKRQLEELKNNPPQTLAGTASGVGAGGTPSNTGNGDGDGEVDTTAEEKDLADKTKAAEDAKKAADDAEKELEDLNKELEGKDKDSDEYKDIQNKIKEKEQSVNKLKKAAEDAEKAKAESQKALDDKKKGSKTQGEPAKKPEDYSNEEIDAMQNELSDLDPEKDKEKIKEKEDLLKSIAKAKGKSEEDFLPKNETDSEGRQVQRKTGPRGGKYFRVKTDEGWGTWQSDTNESLHQFIYDLFY